MVLPKQEGSQLSPLSAHLAHLNYQKLRSQVALLVKSSPESVEKSAMTWGLRP